MPMRNIVDFIAFWYSKFIFKLKIRDVITAFSDFFAISAQERSVVDWNFHRHFTVAGHESKEY